MRRHKYLFAALIVFLSFQFSPKISFAEKEQKFAAVVPGWTYQPKESSTTLMKVSVFEFRGLLNKNGKEFMPSLFVLKQKMPQNHTVDHLEALLNKKYFQGKAILNKKGPLISANGYKAQTYVFVTKEKDRPYINFLYAYHVKKDLIILSQTTTTHNYKNDYQMTSTALNYIKFIN